MTRNHPRRAAGFLRAWLPALASIAAAAAVAFAADPPADFGPEIRLVDAPGNIWWRDIAADGETVHLIWGERPLRYRRSTDQGLTWSEDSVLADDGMPVLTDALVADGPRVYAAYLRGIRHEHDWCCRRPLGDVYLRASKDGGRTWTAETRVTTSGSALRISLAAAGPRLHLAWQDYRDGRWDIYYRRSEDHGRTWRPERLLVQGGPGFGAERPQVASEGDMVHVVWMDDRDRHPPCYTAPACPEVYYKRSADGGATFEPDVRLTRGAPFSGRPDVALGREDTVIVAFDEDEDDNRGHEEHVVRSTDGGVSWSGSERVSFAPGVSNHPEIVAAGADVYLAWFDARDEANTEIYLAVSPDAGATWLPEERVSQAAGTSVTPLMAVSADYLHVIWLDDRDGDNAIWYRRRAR